ncbi:MAG: 3-isopropylmalate dehydratase small subunit [Candidatus Thermoplasmatota archaeon]|nr:3-isopropylmalate dehydratase small subunit [Candidatus Thermoplasmatota archaeon]MBU4255936.1 3-isopropylmalate dehydratase small subunit [Candidatus Thermoplasmatota archaeon]MCG2827169.1 3-isopropylmalate dehydratase [Thermoplasmatales archaeon]
MKGKALVLGDNISTDEIIPGRFCRSPNLGEHCLEGLNVSIKKYRFIVAGENFGCGSSREQAVLALKNAGIKCVISKSFARIFYRNAVNNALPLLECKNISVKNNDVLDVTIRTARIKNLSTGICFQAEKIPGFVMKIIKSGGIIRYYKKISKEFSYAQESYIFLRNKKRGGGL